ncbi:MAG TPA: phosphoglycerate dehydrogenase [Stellaceae bacterium]|nr:phosphoglycerate dehydrogenase [Stellaceae bacterium]
MNPTPIAVLSRTFSRHEVLRAELQARWSDIRFNDSDATLAGAALVEFLQGRERAIVALERIDRALLAQLPGLRIISKYGVGCDNIDLQACAERGVRVGWTGGVNRLAVAEFTLALIIAALRRIGEGALQLRGDGFRQLLGRQLSGRTVGIVGCGFVGSELVRLLQPFGCRLLVHDIRDLRDFCARVGAEPVDLSTLLRRAEVVTLHVPATPATRQMIDAEALRLVRPDAVLINTARGGIVDEAALYEALVGKRLAAAAIDVFAVEPPVDRRLARLANVIATPHMAASTDEARLAMGRAAIEGLETADDPLALVPEYLR